MKDFRKTKKTISTILIMLSKLSKIQLRKFFKRSVIKIPKEKIETNWMKWSRMVLGALPKAFLNLKV